MQFSRNSFNSLPGNVKGAIFLMIAAAGFGLMAALIKLSGERLNIMQILLVRQMVMMLFVAPSILRNFPGGLKTNRIGLQFLRILLALAAMSFGFSAVIHLPLAEATTIGFAKIFFTTICAIFFLNEVIGRRRWAAIAIGFVGVLIVLRPGFEGFSVYSIYALIGSAAAGVVMVIIRILTRTETTMSILTYQALGVGIAVAVPGIYFWVWPTLNEWLLLFGVGITSYYSQSFNINAYRYGEASVMASLDYVRLIYSVALGYFIFENLPDIWTWAGAFVIIAASIYTIHREGQRKQVIVRTAEGRGQTP